MPMADPSVSKGGYVRVRLTWTKDNAPWNDVNLYSPRAEIRERPGGPVLTTWDITYDPDEPNIMILTLPATKSILLVGTLVRWDVRFTKPVGEEATVSLRPFYWPPARAPRKKLHVTAPITGAA